MKIFWGSDCMSTEYIDIFEEVFPNFNSSYNKYHDMPFKLESYLLIY